MNVIEVMKKYNYNLRAFSYGEFAVEIANRLGDVELIKEVNKRDLKREIKQLSHKLESMAFASDKEWDDYDFHTIQRIRRKLTICEKNLESYKKEKTHD